MHCWVRLCSTEKDAYLGISVRTKSCGIWSKPVFSLMTDLHHHCHASGCSFRETTKEGPKPWKAVLDLLFKQVYASLAFQPFSSGYVKWTVCKNDFGLVNTWRLVCTRAIRCGVIDTSETKRNLPYKHSEDSAAASWDKNEMLYFRNICKPI